MASVGSTCRVCRGREGTHTTECPVPFRPPEPQHLQADPQAQMTYDVLVETLNRLDRERRIVLCHPDRVQQTREAVAAMPAELMPGLIEVRASRFTKIDELIMFRPPTWLTQPRDTPPPCTECRGVTSHKMDCSIGRRWRQ